MMVLPLMKAQAGSPPKLYLPPVEMLLAEFDEAKQTTFRRPLTRGTARPEISPPASVAAINSETITRFFMTINVYKLRQRQNT